MILSGWKEIAKHLGCGVRTAQPWERFRLPVRRPIPGRRSIVIAESDDLDSWRHDNAFWRKQDIDVLASVQRARQLRKEVKRARELLRTRMDALKKELSNIHKKHRRKWPPRHRSAMRRHRLTKDREVASRLHEKYRRGW